MEPVYYRALVNTGAEFSGVSSKVISELGLKPVGKKDVHSAVRLSRVSSYAFEIGLPIDAEGDSPTELDLMISGTHISLGVVEGVEVHETPSYEVILGMDIISQGDLELRYGFQGHFSFCF